MTDSQMTVRAFWDFGDGPRHGDFDRPDFPRHEPPPAAPPAPDAAHMALAATPPAYDGAIRQQAQAWLANGLIGAGRGDTRDTSYRNIPAIRLEADADPDGNTDFRFWHVDHLLEDAAAGLERFFALQVEWRDKLAKCFQVESEILQYLDNEKTYADEVAAGLYGTPYVEAFQTLQADAAESFWAASARSNADYIANTLYAGPNLVSQNCNDQLAGWLSGCSTFTSGAAGDQITYGWSINGAPAVQNTRPVWLKEAAGVKASFQLGVTYQAAQMDLARQRGAAEAAENRTRGAQARSDWEQKNMEFRRRRTDAARKAAECKVFAFTLEGGALNYREQMAGLAKRMAREATEIFARISPAQTGLVALYNHSVDLPASFFAHRTARITTPTLMDELSNWVRDSLAWLNRFRQLEQSYVLPISVRALVGETAWNAGKATGKWTIDIPISLFDGQGFMRLRGVRAHVYGVGQEAGYWRAELTPPTRNISRHEPGRTLEVMLDLPKISLPRTGSRINAAEQEFVGMLALFNVSPVGTWEISLPAQSSQRQPLSAISDVELEMAVAVRAL